MAIMGQLPLMPSAPVLIGGPISPDSQHWGHFVRSKVCMKCAICGSDANVKSRLRAPDVFMLALLLRPFRCLSCKRRFYCPVWARTRRVRLAPATKASRQSETEPTPFLERGDGSGVTLNVEGDPGAFGLDFTTEREAADGTKPGAKPRDIP